MPSATHGLPGDRARPRRMAALLDQAYQPWLARLSDAERAAIHAWQSLDRRYRSIQAVVRDGAGDDAALAEASALANAVLAGELPQDVEAWRGIRSCQNVFGVGINSLPTLRGEVLTLDGFFAVTLDPRVAVAEFTRPPLPGGPVLFRIRLPAGVHAAWISLAGDSALRYQRELLLIGPIALRIGAASYAGEVPILEVEVV
ncbi:hypothetical protein Namu_4524 [Nakamurella multipartita DSM 44233]|uniref:ADP ribosyltransferase domain-containing protein n=2 Tax=Nakamurella TaxID=53460 RepID=C8X6Q5_NAKMY|nr:hypothetical protein Namu_4524 [Nakamurella multipartita DSM 44233]